MPRTGACLIIANHQSYLDPPLIGLTTLRPLHYVARIGLFESAAFAWLIRALNAVPIRESGSDAKAMREVLKRLEGGASVVLFPEGARTHDGAVRPFKRGVGLIVKKSHCPVVPMAIEGAYDAWPRRMGRPRLFGCRLAAAVGEPIPHDELMRDGADAALQRLHDEVEKLRAELAPIVKRKR